MGNTSKKQSMSAEELSKISCGIQLEPIFDSKSSSTFTCACGATFNMAMDYANHKERCAMSYVTNNYIQ